MSDKLFEERLSKLKKIEALGFHPYPEKYEKTHYSMDALAEGQKGTREVEEVMQNNKKNICLAGRMVSFRDFGKLNFAHLLDDKGKIQICFAKGQMSEKEEQLMKLLDIGDFIGVKGELFTTKHGETTVLVGELMFLGKALRPLPEKFHGLKDQEAKYRQRYLDLIMDTETRKRFDLRSQILRKLREFYWSKGFMEIETPVLENISSGAAAKPFSTHHNALDIEVFLRIAAGELWQKTAVVGGYEKTFEVARCFRNEGMDPSHLQEFTMIEHYAAYWSFEDNMKFTEEMFEYLMKEVMGTTKVMIKDQEGKEAEIDFKTPWPRKDYRQMIKEDSGIDILDYENADDLRKAIQEKKIVIEDAKKMGYGNLVDHLYKKVSRPKLIQPCFVIKHPKDTKPLARRNDEDSRVCDTFQLLINTWEVVNAYGELVDPLDQRERFVGQSKAKAGGDEEAMSMNEEYLTAMEHGMPPISGWGMGIDRLVTLLSQQDNLRDVVMFPLLKPAGGGNNVETRDLASLPKNPTPASEKIEAGISYDDALKLLKQHVKDPANFNHSRESEVVMRGLARHLGEDEELWGIAGLLHDIDWEASNMEMEKHGVLCRDILKNAGVSDELISVIISHVYGTGCGAGEYEGLERNSKIEHALACAETVTGLIYSYGLMRPTRSLEGAEVKSVKKKFKDKSFAANVNRDVIRECEKIGVDLDTFFQIALDSMREIEKEVGLGK